MLQDQKILITGMTGQIAFPMAAYLAEHNEVWGIARFSAEGSRERVEAAGIHTEVVDVADGDFSMLLRLRAPAPSPYSPIHQDDMNAQVEPSASPRPTATTDGGERPARDAEPQNPALPARRQAASLTTL